jgi:hypothetical protein
MEVIDDGFTFAKEEDSSGKTHVFDHVVIVPPGVNLACELAMACVELEMSDDTVPTSTRRARDVNLAHGRLRTDDVADSWVRFQDDVIWSAIHDFLDSKRCVWESRDPNEWTYKDITGREHVANTQDIFNIATAQVDYVIRKRHYDRLHVDCFPCEEQPSDATRPIDAAEAERTDRVIIEWCR